MRIIAVDDERMALNTLQRSLEEVVGDADVRYFDRASLAIAAVQNGFLPDVAFLDIELPGISGIEMARQLKDIYPDVNIVFVTGYSEYAVEAIALRISGYLLKPVTEERVQYELDNLRNPIKADITKKITVRTFANFEVFAGNQVVEFRRSKSKEIFAYLIDRRGTSASYAEIAAVIWEGSLYDRSHQKQLHVFIHDMIKSLKAVGAEDIIIKNRMGIMVDTKKIDCDAYRFFRGDTSAINAYRGEYMAAYSWAEFTHGVFR